MAGQQIVEYQDARPVTSYAIFKPHVNPLAGSIAAFFLFLFKIPYFIAVLPASLQAPFLREIQPRLALTDVIVIGLLLMVAGEFWMGTHSGYAFSRRERLGNLVIGTLLLLSIVTKVVVVL